MDRVTLRTLTFKSTLNFGKYSDYTVQQVIDQNPIDGIQRKQINYYGVKLYNKALLQRKNHGK